MDISKHSIRPGLYILIDTSFEAAIWLPHFSISRFILLRIDRLFFCSPLPQQIYAKMREESEEGVYG